MKSTIYTDVRVAFDPSAQVAPFLGPWRLTYKKHGTENEERFMTATDASRIGLLMESGRFDRLPGNEPKKPMIGAARPLLDALRAVLDAADVVVRAGSADIFTDAHECEDEVVGARAALATLEAARNAALALLDAAGVPR